MNRNKKYIGPVIFIGFTITFFLTLIITKDKLIKHLDGINKPNKEESTRILSDIFNDYNIQEEDRDKIVFLEFGATTCASCKAMKNVLDEVKKRKSKEVLVIFMNLNQKKAQEYADNFNINMIPTQILINKEGVEFFRHTGFIAYDELLIEFQKQ